jgi:hypothetical protein
VDAALAALAVLVTAVVEALALIPLVASNTMMRPNRRFRFFARAPVCNLKIAEESERRVIHRFIHAKKRTRVRYDKT